MSLQTTRACLVAIGWLALAAPSWASSHAERMLKLDPGGRFVLDSDAGSVTVMGSDQPGAIVVVSSDRDDFQSKFDFTFEENPGVVRVTARRRAWHLFDFLTSYGRLRFDIRVPKTTALEIKTGGGSITAYSLSGDGNLNTAGGSIEVSTLTGALHTHTSGGHIHVQQIHGEAELRTSGGGIDADSIDGRLTAYTAGGSIRINQVTGRVDAHTSGGSISAIFSKGDSGGGTLETSGGSIYAKIDPAVNLEVDLSTSGGSVRSGISLRGADTSSRHTLRGTLGSGGQLLRMHTSGGSVRLDPL